MDPASRLTPPPKSEVGAAQRVDLQRHREVLAEHRALLREYGEVQQRVTRWMEERQREQAAWEAERVRSLGREMALQAQLLQAQGQLAQWQQQVPQLAERQVPQRRLAELQERHRDLQRELNRRQDESARVAVPPVPHPLHAPHPQDASQARTPRAVAAPSDPGAAALAGVVLCVGGRSGQVPIYRRAVEDAGAQFLHHDGSAEHRPERLDPQLAAADLVICQTGCISHDAYWRVKDHCKRHGKRCLFVETPSRSAFQRALAEAAQQTPSTCPAASE